MSRITPILSLLFALAACGPKSTGGPVGHSGGTSGQTLAVTLVPGGEDGMEPTKMLGPTEGSHFPAVSDDGTTVVDLVQDAEDFSGIPISTVVFWTKNGVVGAHRLTEQNQATVVAEINAKLAETGWHPIDRVEATGESEDTGAPDTLELGDGITIKLEQVEARFPSPGTSSEQMGGGGCGEIMGLADGFGSRELGFAVVFPRANLGGDDCFGSPSADLAIVVPIS